MRPLRLDMEGFGTFRDPVTLDFDGRRPLRPGRPHRLGQDHRHRRDLLRPIRQRPTVRQQGQRLADRDDGHDQDGPREPRRSRRRRRVHRDARSCRREASTAERDNQRGPARKPSTATCSRAAVARSTMAVEALLGLTFEHFTRCGRPAAERVRPLPARQPAPAPPGPADPPSSASSLRRVRAA